MDSDDAKELTNKIRWAIGSTLDNGGGGGSSIPYREQMWLASMLTDRVVGVLSALRAIPSGKKHVKVDRKLMQSLLTQVDILE